MQMWIRIYIRILPVAHPQIRTSAFYQSPNTTVAKVMLLVQSISPYRRNIQIILASLRLHKHLH